MRSNVIGIELSSSSVCVIATSRFSRSSSRCSWCMMSYRSSLLLACLLMIDANMWRDLETVSRFTDDVESVFCATFSRASCTALIVASGVSGDALVLHPGGASSLRAQSLIGAKLSSFCRAPLLLVQYQMSSIVPVVSGLSSSPLSLLSSMSISVSKMFLDATAYSHSSSPVLFSVICPSCVCGHSGGNRICVWCSLIFLCRCCADVSSSSANTLLHNQPLWLRAGVLYKFAILGPDRSDPPLT